MALARARINSPELILADEPTAHLDRASAQRVIDRLVGLTDRGCCVVVASHDPEVAKAADRRD